MDPGPDEMIRKGNRKFGGNGYAYCFNCGHSFICVYKCQPIKLCALSVFSLLLINSSQESCLSKEMPSKMVRQSFPRRDHPSECPVRTDVFIPLLFHSICLKVGGESAISEIIITGSEEWAKLNRCYLIGNNVKLLCDSKANDTSVGPERNGFIGKYIEEMEGV